MAMDCSLLVAQVPLSTPGPVPAFLYYVHLLSTYSPHCTNLATSTSPIPPPPAPPPAPDPTWEGGARGAEPSWRNQGQAHGIQCCHHHLEARVAVALLEEARAQLRESKAATITSNALPNPTHLQLNLYISILYICITSLLALSMPARIWDYG